MAAISDPVRFGSDLSLEMKDKTRSAFAQQLINAVKGPFINRSRQLGHQEQEGITIEPTSNFQNVISIIKETLEEIDLQKTVTKIALNRAVESLNSVNAESVRNEVNELATQLADLNDRGTAILRVTRPIIEESARVLKGTLID
ncbi:MAG TPA: hypothetical protein VLG44_07760 [Chlamydiales bacterium]|nr:hypothetical protein [Chlamydiales bacterium]